MSAVGKWTAKTASSCVVGAVVDAERASGRSVAPVVDAGVVDEVCGPPEVVGLDRSRVVDPAQAANIMAIAAASAIVLPAVHRLIGPPTRSD